MKCLKQLFYGLVLATTLTATKPLANVYICNSSTSVAYHSKKDCRGLNRCTHTIIEVSEEKAAKEYSKRKCKVCY